MIRCTQVIPKYASHITVLYQKHDLMLWIDVKQLQGHLAVCIETDAVDDRNPALVDKIFHYQDRLIPTCPLHQLYIHLWTTVDEADCSIGQRVGSVTQMELQHVVVMDWRFRNEQVHPVCKEIELLDLSNIWFLTVRLAAALQLSIDGLESDRKRINICGSIAEPASSLVFSDHGIRFADWKIASLDCCSAQLCLEWCLSYTDCLSQRQSQSLHYSFPILLLAHERLSHSPCATCFTTYICNQQCMTLVEHRIGIQKSIYLIWIGLVALHAWLKQLPNVVW